VSAILWQLAATFAGLSLIAVGGGIAIVPEMNRLAVEVHGWMSDAHFAQLFALAQAAPGPNIIVVGLIGWHVAGLPGLAVAMGAITTPAALLAYGFTRFRRRLAGRAWLRVVEQGLVPVAVGLILATGLILGDAASRGPLSVGLILASTLFVWLTRASPLWVLAAGAVAGPLLF
jgi:chromate transporter